MRYINSFLNHFKRSPKEILYKDISYGEWVKFKNNKEEEITDSDIKRVKSFILKIDIPCKHGKNCPTCPDPKIKKSGKNILEIQRSQNIKYEIIKFYDDWYIFIVIDIYEDPSGRPSSIRCSNMVKCDTMEGVEQYLLKLSK